MPTYGRHDRFIANADWCLSFPNTMIYNLPMLKSDHAPILAILDAKPTKKTL
jgi:hypothetical protein